MDDGINHRIDPLTPEQRKKTMQRVRSKDTKPEKLVRRLVYSMGYRYRLHYKTLPGKPDLAFPSRKKVIFVHGCFWHGHDCKAGRKRPKTNRAYWDKKLARNKERDEEQREQLREQGWDVLVIWECELKNIESIRKRIVEFLEDASSSDH